MRENDGRPRQEPSPDDSGQLREYSRYQSTSSYWRARRGRSFPRVLGVVSALVIVVGFLAIAGPSIMERLPLSSLPLAGDGSEEAADEEESAAVTIDVAVAGDVYLRYAAFQSGQTDTGDYDYSHLFEHVEDQLSEADLAIVNQEGVIAGADLGYNATRTNVASPDALGEAEAAAGIDCVLRANDHALDKGYDGLHNELAFWEEHNVEVVGASDPGSSASRSLRSSASDEDADEDDADPNTTYLFEKDGFTLAVLNYSVSSLLSPYDSTTDADYVSLWDEDTVEDDVQAARRDGGDMVIACVHWGDEYDTEVTDEQREAAQVLADAGVDVILGSHPHVLQEVETLSGSGGNETLCYWSLGSLINSGISGAGYVGGIAELELQKAGDGTCSVISAQLVPTVIHVGWDADTMTVYPVADYTSALSQTNDSTSITTGYVGSLLDTLFGSDYDASEGVVTIV